MEADHAAASIDRAPSLILKRATKRRPDGTWPDVDYDLFDSEQHIGRKARESGAALKVR